MEGHILIVEDDPDIAEIVNLALDGCGLAIEHAFNGRDAIDRAAALGPPALIILDLHLPGLDGRGVATAIRAMYGTGLAVILLTSASVQEAAESASFVDAFATIRKPFDLDVLRATALAALERVV